MYYRVNDLISLATDEVEEKLPHANPSDKMTPRATPRPRIRLPSRTPRPTPRLGNTKTPPLVRTLDFTSPPTQQTQQPSTQSRAEVLEQQFEEVFGCKPMEAIPNSIPLVKTPEDLFSFIAEVPRAEQAAHTLKFCTTLIASFLRVPHTAVIKVSMYTCG